MSGITIGSNISSLMAQRQLGKSTDAWGRASEKLSSGMRINRASDDAAGLAIASTLDSSVRIFTVGVRNINDGISMLSIAEGALDQLSGITTRLMELAEQSANGSFSSKQRASMASEADQLTNEFNRIISTSEFNNINFLDLSTTDIRMQAGFGTDGSIAVNVTDDLSRTAGDGTFTSFRTYAGASRGLIVTDLNGDGKIDIATGPDGTTPSAKVYIGNGDGTFKAFVSYEVGLANTSGYATALSGDYNGDGKIDLIINNTADNTISVLSGNGDGTFKAQVSFSVGTTSYSIVDGDFNGDGIKDIAATSAAGPVLRILYGNGNGTFNSSISFASVSTYGLTTTDLDNDGILDIVSVNGSMSILKGNGDGTFKRLTAPSLTATSTWVEAVDFNRDGYMDLVTADYAGGSGTTVSVYIGNGNGSFLAAASYAPGINNNYVLTHGDFDGDGVQDILTSSTTGNVSVLVGNGDGTFASGQTFSSLAGYQTKVADINGDGVLDLIGSQGLLRTNLGNTHRVTTLPFLDILTQQGARDALTVLQGTLTRIDLQLGSIGAAQSRLQVAKNNLFSAQENYRAAASRIIDVDVAEESANLARTGVLQQAGAAVLAQTNQLPALVVQLLR